MSRLAPPLALFVLAACAQPPPPLLPVSRDFVIVRLYIDPSTRLGEYIVETPGGLVIGDSLSTLDCASGFLLLIRVESDPEPRDPAVGEPADGIGRAQLLFATAEGTEDPCGGQGLAAIQPLSYSDVDAQIPLIEGPLFIEGETLDGRLPIGRIAMLSGVAADSFEAMPHWWQISARAHGLLRARNPDPDATGRDDDILLSDTRAEAVWRIQQLRTELLTDLDPMAEPGVNVFDTIIEAGVQPGVDLDGDGLERFADTNGDGLVDRCTDGDGTEVTDIGCAADPRFADGYELRLIFRTVPIEAH